VVSYRSEAAAASQLCGPVYGTANTATHEEIPFRSELMASGVTGNPKLELTEDAGFGATVFRHTGANLRHRPCNGREARCLREKTLLRLLPSDEYVESPRLGRRGDGSRVRSRSSTASGVPSYPAPTLLYRYGAYESCEDRGVP